MFCCCRQLWAIRNRATHHPPACPAWGGVELGCALSRPEARSVHCVRADCGGRLFTAKLAVVMHNLVHQLLNHLLADDPSVSESVPRVKPRKRRNGFRQSGVDWETAAACVKMKLSHPSSSAR